ncbi:MAG: hypothetical protein ABW208_06720 [Pyrinomonadaceae bacterium]
MTGCTDPKRWATAPGADAAEEEVMSYLAHVEACPFHAAVEQHEEELARGVATLARRDLVAHGSEPLAHAAGGDDGLGGRVKSRREASGRILSIRVNGVERARVDLTSRREAALEVEAGDLVAVWRRGRGDGDDGVYLTSYLAPEGGGPADAKQVSETALEDGRRITFTAEAGADAGTRRLVVAYAAPVRPHTRRLPAALRARSLAGRARALSRRSARRLAAALCALLAAVLLALVLYSRTGGPTPVTEQEQPRRPGAEHVPAPDPTPASEGARAQNRQDVPPAIPPVSATPSPTPAPSPTRAPRRTHEQMTVADVRRVYVSTGEGDYDRQLREALIERLRAGDRFIVVAGERQADAVLLREQSRGAGVSVQLLTRTGKPLWYTTQPTAAGGVENVAELAARIVAALTAAADGPRPPGNAPLR